MQITVSYALETMLAIGKEREKVVDQLSYSKQIASLGDRAEALLEDHLEKLNLAYGKLLDQVGQYQISSD